MNKPWEIENYLKIHNDQLHIDGVSAVELANEHGTPLFVFSEQRIRHNIDRIKRAAELIERPLKVCYAAKAMSTMGILRAVKNADCDIEVNSGGELFRVTELIEAQRDLLTGALEVHLSTVSNRLNEVMRRLAAVATIFLPITFLSGFFGQNFAYMVRHVDSATAFAIGTLLQLAVAVGVVAVLHVRRWI